MFELLFCSLLTILPDYLIRRYGQGKRIGREITLFSVWYELRYGIVTCLMLTVSLITLIFYYHPTATGAVSIFRTVPILPDGSGRVEEIYIELGLETPVRAGDRLFKLNTDDEDADILTAQRQVSEIEAELQLAQSELAVAEGQVGQAEAALKQARDELDTRQELMARNANVVTPRDIEKLENTVAAREGALAAAVAGKQLTETKIGVSLPAKLDSAKARLSEAEVTRANMTVYAGVDGTVTQFTLRVGDIVNPLMRPAGILIPADSDRARILAGFGQIEAQVLKIGMMAEIVCTSVPFTVIPMVVVEIQDNISSGQLAASDRLTDVVRDLRPGTISTLLEPLYKGGLDKVPPGSVCIANAYTSNHERLTSGEPLGTGQYLFLHAVDTVGLVHAMILRLQALLYPIQALVLTGH